MAKSEQAVTIIVLIIAAIAVIYVLKNLKAFEDFFKSGADAIHNFEVSLQDGLNAADKSLGDASTAAQRWWQQFYNNTLSKPLVPLSTGVTKSELNDMTKSTTGAEVDGSHPSTTTAGDPTQKPATPKQTADQSKPAGQDTTPADLKPARMVQINLIEHVGVNAQTVIDAKAQADATSNANMKSSPTDANIRAASLATHTNPPATATNNIDPTKIPNPMSNPSQGTIFDNLLHDLSGILAPLSAIDPIARPVAPLIEVP